MFIYSGNGVQYTISEKFVLKQKKTNYLRVKTNNGYN